MCELTFWKPCVFFKFGSKWEKSRVVASEDKWQINFFYFIENDATENQTSPPTFLIPLCSISMQEGEGCEFQCKVTGNPLPVVQWFKNDVCIDSSPNYEITYNNGDAKLSLNNVTTGDCAIYTCIASNTSGTLSSSAELSVKGKYFVISIWFWTSSWRKIWEGLEENLEEILGKFERYVEQYRGGL